LDPETTLLLLLLLFCGSHLMTFIHSKPPFRRGVNRLLSAKNSPAHATSDTRGADTGGTPLSPGGRLSWACCCTAAGTAGRGCECGYLFWPGGAKPVGFVAGTPLAFPFGTLPPPFTCTMDGAIRSSSGSIWKRLFVCFCCCSTVRSP